MYSQSIVSVVKLFQMNELKKICGSSKLQFLYGGKHDLYRIYMEYNKKECVNIYQQRGVERIWFNKNYSVKRKRDN